MTYTPKTWLNNEIIYADDLNHIENGIDANDNAISDLNSALGELENGFRLTKSISANWVSGYLRDNGTIGSDSNYCTTSNYVATVGHLAITLAASHKAKVIIYDSEHNVVEIIRDITTSIVIKNTNGFFKAQIGKVPASEITPSYVTDDVIAFSNYRYADVDYIKAQASKLKIDFEKGSFLAGPKRSNTIDAYNSYFRNAYDIYVGGASAFDFSLSDPDATLIETYFYSDSMVLIGYINLAPESVDVSIPSGTVYMNIEFKSDEYPVTAEIVFYGAGSTPEQRKRYPVATDSDGSESTTIMVNDDVCTTIRLILPPNYSADGKKVPLILYFDGSGNFTTWDADITSSAKLPNLEYARDEGYAVLSVFGWGSNLYTKYANCGRAMYYPTPTNIACVKSGIAYALDRYNLDPHNVHLVCKSQGGQLATFFVSNPGYDFRSISMFCPVNDYLSMPGTDYYVDTRKALVEDLDLVSADTYGFDSTGFNTYSVSGRAFWTANLDKLIGLNEAWTCLVGGSVSSRFDDSMDDAEAYWTDQSVTGIYQHTDYAKISKIPVKIWAGKLDHDTPYLKSVELVSQLKNGGTEAVIVINNTGGHNSWDVTTKVDDITTALGIFYETVTLGWYQAIKWIRDHSTK